MGSNHSSGEHYHPHAKPPPRYLKDIIIDRLFPRTVRAVTPEDREQGQLHWVRCRDSDHHRLGCSPIPLLHDVESSTPDEQGEGEVVDPSRSNPVTSTVSAEDPKPQSHCSGREEREGSVVPGQRIGRIEGQGNEA